MNLAIKCIVVLCFLAPFLAFARERRRVDQLENHRQLLREQLWTEQGVREAYQKWYSREHTALVNAVEARDRAQQDNHELREELDKARGSLRLAELQNSKYRSIYGTATERDLTATDIHP